MSSDISKLAVYDSRIVQQQPSYAVEKGALSITNSPFAAISQSQSQHSYNIYVPSENVYVARDMDWASTVNLRVDVQLNDTTGQYPFGQPLLELGVDGSLAAFPLNAMCATITATINDTTTTINSQDVLTEIMRLTDYRGNRIQRTCPTMMDKYLLNSDALNAQNDPMSGYTNAAHDYAEPTNGSWNNVVFTNAQGQVLLPSVPATTYVDSYGNTVDVVDGIPVSTVQVAGPNAGGVNGIYSVYLQFRTVEKLSLSPFIFANEHGEDTGLFGINNIQLVMNMRDPNRALRLRDKIVGTTSKLYYGTSVLPDQYSPPISYNTGVATGPFSDSQLHVQFLTPSLSIPLPPKSCVPYLEFPRYITQVANPLNAAGQPGDSAQLVSQTITLPQIPDLLIIYVKAIANPTETAVDRSRDPALPQYGSGYLPVLTSQYGSRSVAPLSVNFDNFSGLLSSHTSEQLYAMSVRNGLEMDWNTWSGQARVASGAGGTSVPTVGGFLVLKPGVDLTLQEGQAPSLVGNFTLQFNLSVRNTYPFSVRPQIFIITANSGFFESIRGSSRIIKGVLSEQDIIAAPLAPAGTMAGLARMVGGKMLRMANRMMYAPRSGERRESQQAPDRQRSGGKMGLAQRLM
jgi:hypothetical protein